MKRRSESDAQPFTGLPGGTASGSAPLTGRRWAGHEDGRRRGLGLQEQVRVLQAAGRFAVRVSGLRRMCTTCSLHDMKIAAGLPQGRAMEAELCYE